MTRQSLIDQFAQTTIQDMRTTPSRKIVLAQLPVPPLGPDPVRGNVPLAAAYLKLWAEKQHLTPHYDIQILPAYDANTLGDHAPTLPGLDSV